MVGFDYHGGWSHPVYDGFVICEEFVDQVVDAWNRDQEEQERKEREKYESRVYGNWKRLIKGLFIRRRLQTKYNFGKEEEEKPLEVAKVPMVPADMAKAKKRSKK
jgi:xeroderma pigmentosum group C-complementing protein